ncbi:MAG: hypothetical protein ACJ798_05495 [Phenylobacterium sp.]
MSKFYDDMDARTKGAWVVHHGQKTNAAVSGPAEFPALDVAGKAASLLSQLAGSDQNSLSSAQVSALGRAAGLNPRLELPGLLSILEDRRLIDRAAGGDLEVLGLSTQSTVQHAAEIFEEQDPSSEERATIAIAELTSATPVAGERTSEFLSDEFRLAGAAVRDVLTRSETVGFVDAEGVGDDKLYFNGHIFRRDALTKISRVLDSLAPADNTKISELDQELDQKGCVTVEFAEKTLGLPLFEKLRAAGMYDINHVANPAGEHGFVTRPAAFHKFNDPLVDDAFDLAKALVAALAYGMTQSSAGRGRIDYIGALLRKLIAGQAVGPATAIGEDYRVLETKGVLRVTSAAPRSGYLMRLLKKDVGEMALRVLTTGETASTNALGQPFAGVMTGYSAPEKTRWNFRQKQGAPSKRLTQDVLQALRTKGTF